MHHRNRYSFAAGMCKEANGISPEKINEIFQLEEESH